MSQKDAVSWCY